MGLNQERVNNGKECCKLANQRFGLQVLCEALLSDLNCCDDTRGEIINLARGRDFKRCSALIEEAKLHNQRHDAKAVNIKQFITENEGGAILKMKHELYDEALILAYSNVSRAARMLGVSRSVMNNYVNGELK